MIEKNFNAGGCCPMYWRPSVDISEDILKIMNDAYDRSGKAPKLAPNSN